MDLNIPTPETPNKNGNLKTRQRIVSEHLMYVMKALLERGNGGSMFLV